MKLNKIIVLALFSISTAFANGQNAGNVTSKSKVAANNEQGQLQNSNSTSTTQNAIDYSQTTTNSSTASDLARGIGTGIAPNLTSGFNTCLGSASAGFGWSGFGFGLGKTYQDDPCNRRQDAMVMAQMGSVATAREVMCENVRVLRSSVRAGKPCWLQDENLLDELSDAEQAYYHKMMANNTVSPNQAAIIQHRMDTLTADTNQKLDNIHRLNQIK